MNFEDIWTELVGINLYRALEKIDDSMLTSDYSEFVYVDGEEGDHGNVYYRLSDSGVLIATHVFEGGDSGYWELTEAGKEFVREEFKKAVDKVLLNI